MFSRRDGLKLTLALATAAASLRTGFLSSAGAEGGPAFKVPPLGYPFDALEPYIDATTMMIHHDRHHGAYVAALNGLAEKYPDLTAKTPITILSDLSNLPDSVRTPIRNNLGGHWNHSYFWELMTPGGAKEPSGELKTAIDSAFGTTAQMAEKVNAAGLGRFGSGWAWLIVDKSGKLDIISTPNQDTPLDQGVQRVVLGVDVWEHAYYLKYQNKRADYLKAWWNTVNWDKAAANFAKAPI
ncbi:MAG: superoxide dismutase [Beijerinckiaceae bacterium]|nr:superoxide dismutase [Beijerinckiaceae bacterium]